MKWIAAFLVSLLALAGWGRAAIVQTDVCVYGGTSGGVIAAVQAARQGKTVALLVADAHVGGMTSGGLSATDIGTHGDHYIHGLAREFYTRVGAVYGKQSPVYLFEPKVAEAVFLQMLAESGIAPHYHQQLGSVATLNSRISQVTMTDGTVYVAKVFIDASYEGDLMAMAGVSYTVGRESNSAYGETFNGSQAPDASFSGLKVDPYVTPGVPASGLLPLVQAGSPGVPGAADAEIQAYNYRPCLSISSQRLPILAPQGYDEGTYELVGRLIHARAAAGWPVDLSQFLYLARLPGGKVDVNMRGPVSTDYTGQSAGYPEATYADRAALALAHRNYIQGFLYYLGHSTRVPSATRTQMLSYGFPPDEFPDTGGWPHQLYVREARRMVSDYVMAQADCQGLRAIPEPIGEGAYTIDIHECRRLAVNGAAANEGDVTSPIPGIYPISYRALLPRATECTNLLVPWAISASHVAFGSFRMEPVFMIVSQSAGTAAAFAVDSGSTVQQVSYPKLALELYADDQALGTDSPQNGIVVDNADPAAATITGAWGASTAVPGYWGSNYLDDLNSGKGSKSVRFTPNLPQAGQYDVYLRWTSHPNRATNVPVSLFAPGGTVPFSVDQTRGGSAWNFLRRATFVQGATGSLLIETTGASGYVVADATSWVSVPNSIQPTVQIIASDPDAYSGTNHPARLTVVRPREAARVALSVPYTVSGSASPSDYQPLSGVAQFAVGANAATIAVYASGSIPLAPTKTVTVTLRAGGPYTVGTLNSATANLHRP